MSFHPLFPGSRQNCAVASSTASLQQRALDFRLRLFCPVSSARCCRGFWIGHSGRCGWGGTAVRPRSPCFQGALLRHTLLHLFREASSVVEPVDSLSGCKIPPPAIQRRSEVLRHPYIAYTCGLESPACDEAATVVARQNTNFKLRAWHWQLKLTLFCGFV